MQIIHSRGDHWLLASNILAGANKVYVYDSIYRTIDRETERIIKNLFPLSESLEPIRISQQTGGQDCGVFAIAVSTALAYGQYPETLKFDQPGSALRLYLSGCFEKGTLSLFPEISDDCYTTP